MGILFGLLTAVTWGGSDFLARFATQRLGTLRTTLYMQLTGFILLTIALPWLGGWGHLVDGSGWRPWAWGGLAGVLNVCSTLTLYRSFEVGKLAVVAPLSASYPALTLFFSWLSGEQLSTERIAGIVCTLLGAMVVAGAENKSQAQPGVELSREGACRVAGEVARGVVREDARGGKGLGWALCSVLGFGVLFWFLGKQIVPRLGAGPAVWMIRLTSTIIAAAILLVGRMPMKLIPGRERKVVWGMGLLDTSGFVMSNRGMQLEQIAVIGVLGSLYGAVTFILAAIFLREKISRWQILGIVAIFAGIVLIGH
jgi:drug/metabolite transporter (DMT)-like permease